MKAGVLMVAIIAAFIARAWPMALTRCLLAQSAVILLGYAVGIASRVTSVCSSHRRHAGARDDRASDHGEYAALSTF
jgi:hypothetical protein